MKVNERVLARVPSLNISAWIRSFLVVLESNGIKMKLILRLILNVYMFTHQNSVLHLKHINYDILIYNLTPNVYR